MTVVEMIGAVQMGLDKTSSFETASFEQEEILSWLNEAQLELVKQKFFGNNPRRQDYDNYNTGTKRADDLSNLIRYSSELTYDGSNIYPDFRPHSYHPNIAVVNIHSTTMPHYLFYVGADFKVSATTGDDLAPLETTIIEQKNIGDFVETPTNKPYLRNGFVYLKEGEINVIYDPYMTPVWLYISYVYQPKELVVSIPTGWQTDYSDPLDWDSETLSEGLIAPQVHPEIVALTVNLMLENIADPRYQSHSLELTKKE